MAFNQRKINEIRVRCKDVLANPKLGKYHQLARLLLKDMDEVEEINKENLERLNRRKNGQSNMGYNQNKYVLKTKDGEIVKEYSSLKEAEYEGFRSCCVCNACRNKYMREGNNFYKGYQWYYKSDWEEIKNGNIQGD